MSRAGWLLALLAPSVQAAELLYSNGFDGALGDVTKMYECPANRAHAFQLVTSPRRSGTHAIKVESYGEYSDMCPEWGGAPGKHRVQLQLGIGEAYPGYPDGLELCTADVGPWWVGFSVYVPSGIPTGMFIIFDIKSASAHFGEPTAFFHLNQLDVRLEGAVENAPKLALPRDRWVDLIWMIERCFTGGKMKFWMDGRLTHDQTGPTLPSGCPEVPSWFRIGIYYGTEERPGHRYTVYFDNVRIARGADGYALVAPGEGAAVPRTPNPQRVHAS